MALEQEWLRHEHDGATLERILADDFMHPVAAGVFLTKKEHIDWAISHPAPEGRVQRFERPDVRHRERNRRRQRFVQGRRQADDLHGRVRQRDGRWRAVNAQENAIVRQ